MKKEELLHLHMLMFHVRTYFRDILNDEILTERYDSLEITPAHIHKDKNAHRDALLTLGDEIVSHIHSRNVPVIDHSCLIASPQVAVAH
ncbi:MAG: UPF0058 family protein [Methanoregula sp.]|jgi:hypothetical protein|uniref:UPF0058 family protein n=1 Tax=Methanoregula sp. TaxID=2052170 RepID=UPI003C24C8D0